MLAIIHSIFPLGHVRFWKANVSSERTRKRCQRTECTMDRYNTINPADNDSVASDATVEQSQRPQVAFEQHLGEARQLGPIYPHRELHDITEEDDRLIQAASGAALKRGPPPNATTVEIYDRRLRKLAEALKQSGQSIAGLDDDTLLECSKKLLPTDKVIVAALSLVSKYRERSASALATHYRPSKEDARLIREATAAGFGRTIDAKTAGNYASCLRKLAAALRPLSIAKLSDKALLGHADALFPNDKKVIYALNRLSEYRAIAGPDNLGGEGGVSRLPMQPTADLPVQLFDRAQSSGDAADQDGPMLADDFNAPQAWQGMDLAAHSPAQRGARDVLFNAVDRSSVLPDATFDAPVPWQGMRYATHSPVQSVAQDELFDAADREGLLPATPFNQPGARGLWPGTNSAACPPAQSVAQGELFDAADRNGAVPALGLDASEVWAAMGPATQLPVQSVLRADLFDAAIWQPSSRPQNPLFEEDFGRMMDRDAAVPATLDPTSAVASESFDASLTVPEDFSHGTQPAPDMMRSKLGRWGLLPDAAQRVKTYDIHGERYTAVLGPRGRSDVQLIHLRSPAVGDTFDVSFAVPKDFRHCTQLAPDMMLSTLGKWDFLPVAEHPVMNYEIAGERYTAVLGPRGSNDVQLIHHPRLAFSGDAALVGRTATQHIYRALAPGFDPPVSFELRRDAPSPLAPNLPPPSAASGSGHQPSPQLPELGELFGDDWRHGPREASPIVIDMLRNLDLLPSRDVPMTRFLIHGQPYTAESLSEGRVLLFHRPQFG